ncbi:phosphotransferase [Aeropyrum pernix]|uniref:phosphotransferase n=1 Tax=Aeropyrum pernix TaxID=56636 RepID=UPI0011E542B4|nr:phosphotransferase [Aeropyrum pernix]
MAGGPVEPEEDCGLVHRILRECSCRGSGLTTSSLLCSCRGEDLVVKDYSRKGVKWLITLPYAPVYRYIYSPEGRLRNELKWYRSLRGAYPVPRIVAYCIGEKPLLIREYVDGEPVSNSLDEDAWKALGSGLARLHFSLGMVLGDPNPGNFIYSLGEAWLVDFEQADDYTPQKAAWDLLVLAATTITLASPLKWRFVEAALSSYREAAGDRWSEVLESLGGVRLKLLNPLLVSPLHALRFYRLARSL